MAEQTAAPASTTGEQHAQAAATQQTSQAATGGSAPKTYSDDEVNTFVAREKRAATTRANEAAQKAWLERLGVATAEEADAAIAALKSAKPKAEASEADRAAAKVKSEYETKLAALEQARAQAESRANTEMLRAFAARHVADTNDPELAAVLLGVPYAAKERLEIHDAKIVVVDVEGTVLAHRDPDKWAKEQLAKREFLQKPQGGGAGTRVGAAPTAPAPKRPHPKTQADMITEMTRLMTASDNGGSPGAR